MTKAFTSAKKAVSLANIRFIDATWSLQNPSQGQEVFKASRLPGAVFFDFESLCGEITETTGRHPLPEFETFHKWIESCELHKNDTIITYGTAAARIWWMLFTLGFDVTILEGGRPAWEKVGGPIETTEPKQFVGATVEVENLWPLVTVERQEVLKFDKIIDCRSKERFESTPEHPCPQDRKPGHIEGAVSHPFSSNFVEGGMELLPVDVLRAHCEDTLSGVSTNNAVVYCGSGVTACVTSASMVHTGLGLPKMYIGSWSEWSKHN